MLRDHKNRGRIELTLAICAGSDPATTKVAARSGLAPRRSRAGDQRSRAGAAGRGYSEFVAYIKIVAPDVAKGVLLDEYRTALRRAGKIWNIVRIMSPNPEVLSASMTLYSHIMHGPSPLSRGQREMLAVTVSKANECHY